MTRPGVTFTCYGVPVPQGSTRAFVVKGRAVTTSANSNLRPWRDSLAAAARFAMQEVQAEPFTGPVAVELLFALPRPKSRPKKDRWPDRRPDIDKTVRACLDGITGPVIGDDAQVCTLHAVKEYAGAGGTALPEPGVVINVWPLT